MNRRGWWYLLSFASVPFLLLARTGVFGREAREESDVALEDWASYGRAVLVLLELGAAAIVLFLLYDLVR